jgi:hypothetical protein
METGEPRPTGHRELPIGFAPTIGGLAHQSQWTTGEMAWVTGAPGPSRW